MSKKYSAERQFGIIFFIFFLIIGFLPFLYEKNINYIFLGIGLIILLLGFLFPVVLYYPNKSWIKLGNLIGLVTTPVIISLIYLLTILPISIFFKIIRFDNISRKINKKNKSYWIKRENTSTDISDQY